MAKLTYIKGDATQPKGEGKKIIIHCCNDIGAWGAGFVLALSRRWRAPEVAYRQWVTEYIDSFELGNVQIVQVEEDVFVGNMIGQEGVGFKNNVPPIRYPAIRKCLEKVFYECKENDLTVHAPKFGADLAGGDWEIIESIIKEELVDKGIDVTVYLFEKKG